MTKEETKEAIKVMQAFVDGKEIEYKRKYDKFWWEKLMISHVWDWNSYDYRIKPEPHYRPFQNAEEVMEAIKEHGDWVKYKGAYCRICVVYSSCCDFNGFSLSYKDAVKSNTYFRDGTPFGILEN